MAYVGNEKVRKNGGTKENTENENIRVGTINIVSRSGNRLEIENEIRTDKGEWGGCDKDEGESDSGKIRKDRNFLKNCRIIHSKQ